MSSARIVILLYMAFDTKKNHGDWVVPRNVETCSFSVKWAHTWHAHFNMLSMYIDVAMAKTHYQNLWIILEHPFEGMLIKFSIVNIAHKYCFHFHIDFGAPPYILVYVYRLVEHVFISIGDIVCQLAHKLHLHFFLEIFFMHIPCATKIENIIEYMDLCQHLTPL